MNTSGWNDPDPAEVFHPATDAEWDAAISRYLGSRNDRPLRRCVNVARTLGAKTIVVETRYLDPDYRSEFSAYYSKQFADVPDSTHRLHFFSKILTKRTMWRTATSVDYLGYVVIRPATTGLVSRAMLPPPPELQSAVRTSVTETVNFFGQDLDVTGVPFAQQDAQIGACAQAAAWSCHYSAFLRHDVHRRPKAEFTLRAPASLHPSRPIPSGGLTVLQLCELFRTLELPALHYEIGKLPSPGLSWQPPDPKPSAPNQHPGLWDNRIVTIACRHLNSGNPILIGTLDHAFILCGYRRTNNPRPGWIEFVRHDDQEGPYSLVSDVLADVAPDTGKAYGPWQTMQVPMPDKIWLAPEVAELQSGELLLSLSREITSAYPGKPFLDLDELIRMDRLRVHTYVTRSNAFKGELKSRGLATNFRRGYAFARLPRYVWVVEAIDKDLRDSGLPCVLGEAVLDATSSDHDARKLAVHIHGVMQIQTTSGIRESPIFGSYAPYESGGRGPA